MLAMMIAAHARSPQAKTAADERKRKRDMILQNLKEAKRLTSGVMVSNGIRSLRGRIFLEAYHEKRREANEKFEKNVNAKKANVRKKIEGIKKLREKYGHETTHIFA